MTDVESLVSVLARADLPKSSKYRFEDQRARNLTASCGAAIFVVMRVVSGGSAVCETAGSGWPWGCPNEDGQRVCAARERGGGSSDLREAVLAGGPMACACVRRVNVGRGSDLWGTVLGDGPLRMACARVRVQKLRSRRLGSAQCSEEWKGAGVSVRS